MILILDNYDSFTYNLYQIAGTIDPDIQVEYSDRISIAEIEKIGPSHIILSPGPGKPKDAGICKEVITHFGARVPILGVCLGHQAVCESFGAVIGYAKTLTHGKATITHLANGSPVFRGLPPLLKTGRYHSLTVQRSTLPDELLVIAETDDGQVMGVKHRDYSIFGLQFHPESILTPQGDRIIENFLHIGGNEHD